MLIVQLKIECAIYGMIFCYDTIEKKKIFYKSSIQNQRVHAFHSTLFQCLPLTQSSLKMWTLHHNYVPTTQEEALRIKTFQIDNEANQWISLAKR